MREYENFDITFIIMSVGREEDPNMKPILAIEI